MLGGRMKGSTTEDYDYDDSDERCSWYNIFCHIYKFFNSINTKITTGNHGVAKPNWSSWKEAPMHLDWRYYGAVKEDVEQQSSCGACWAIAA